MEGKLDLITVRKASMVANRDSSDSIVILNDKKFRVKAEFSKNFNEDESFLDLSQTIYKTSNFIIVDEQIIHRNDYISGSLVLDQFPIYGSLIYFLIPLTKEDWIDIEILSVSHIVRHVPGESLHKQFVLNIIPEYYTVSALQVQMTNGIVASVEDGNRAFNVEFEDNIPTTIFVEIDGYLYSINYW